jgi:hypothetical protein
LGKLPVEGHCCWPQQVWLDEQSRCAGEPECPAGLLAKDESCAKPPPPPPPPPPPKPKPAAVGAVRVGFVGKQPKTEYEIDAGGRRCVTPCELKLQPGRQHVSVRGPVMFDQDLYVPARNVRVEVEHASRRAQVAGAILLPTGLLATVIALAALVANGSDNSTIIAIALLPLTAGIMTTGAVLLGKSGANLLSVTGNLGERKVSLGFAAAPRPGGGTVGLSITF